jgi:hypothetical protein
MYKNGNLMYLMYNREIKEIYPINDIDLIGFSVKKSL